MSKTLEELGYEKLECEEYVAFGGKDKEILFVNKKENYRIAFFMEEREVHKYHEYFDDAGYITMEELKAIYKYCEDNKWI